MQTRYNSEKQKTLRKHINLQQPQTYKPGSYNSTIQSIASQMVSWATTQSTQEFDISSMIFPISIISQNSLQNFQKCLQKEDLSILYICKTSYLYLEEAAQTLHMEKTKIIKSLLRQVITCPCVCDMKNLPQEEIKSKVPHRSYPQCRTKGYNQQINKNFEEK